MSGFDRSVPPPPGRVRPFAVPDVERVELASDFALRVAPRASGPLVSVVVVLAAGEWALASDEAGLGVAAAAGLEGGTAARAGADLAEAMERVGAAFEAACGWDATTVSLSCLADRLPVALGLLAEVVRSPTFPADEFGRVVDQQKARLRQRRMSPASLATDWSARLIHADGAAFGRPLAGTEGSLAGLTPDAARAFVSAWYRPGRGGVVVAGDVDATAFAGLVEETFGAWSGAPPKPSGGGPEGRYARRTLHVIDRPGAVQSEIRVGHVGVPRSDPEHAALVVGNAAFGGTFTSRLNLNLRERNGFTYGARSRFAFRRVAGPFSVSTAVGTDVTAAAVREIFSEMERFVAEGPTPDETTAVRDFLVGVYPLRFESTSQVASRVAELIVYDLPDDEHARHRERLREVSSAAAHAAFSDAVHPDRATVVVVGDAKEIRSSLEATGLGEVFVHEVEE